MGDERNQGMNRMSDTKLSTMSFKDIKLNCIDCGQEFIFTAREQSFFAEKGFQQPRRCYGCRRDRQIKKKDRYNEPRPDATERRGVEYDVICAECGKGTTVPFYPAQGRPVYCRECFLGR